MYKNEFISTVRENENGVTNNGNALMKVLANSGCVVPKEFEESVIDVYEAIEKAEQETWNLEIKLDNPLLSCFLGDDICNAVSYSHKVLYRYAGMLEKALRDAGYENLESEEDEMFVLNDEGNDLEPDNTRMVVSKPGRKQESRAPLGKYGRVSITANGFVFHMFMPYDEFTPAQVDELTTIINQWLHKVKNSNTSRKQSA